MGSETFAYLLPVVDNRLSPDRIENLFQLLARSNIYLTVNLTGSSYDFVSGENGHSVR